MTIPYQQPQPNTGKLAQTHTHTFTHTNTLISMYNIDMNTAYSDDICDTASMSKT